MRSSSGSEPSDNKTSISMFRYVWAETERKHISSRAGSASGANGSITDISSLSARFTFIVKQMLACGISHRKQHRSCTTSMKLCDVDQDVDDEKKHLDMLFEIGLREPLASNTNMGYWVVIAVKNLTARPSYQEASEFSRLPAWSGYFKCVKGPIDG